MFGSRKAQKIGAKSPTSVYSLLSTAKLRVRSSVVFPSPFSRFCDSSLHMWRCMAIQSDLPFSPSLPFVHIAIDCTFTSPYVIRSGTALAAYS